MLADRHKVVKFTIHLISGQTSSRDVPYISKGLVPDLPRQSNPRDQFRWLHQSQRRCFEQGGSISRPEWVKSNLHKFFDYIVFVLAVFVWVVILFMQFKFLSNWNCPYMAPMLNCHKNLNFVIGDLTEAESKLFIADHNKKNMRSNQTQALGDMLPETRDMLRQFYRPFNVNLSRLLHSDHNLWSNWLL